MGRRTRHPLSRPTPAAAVAGLWCALVGAGAVDAREPIPDPDRLLSLRRESAVRLLDDRGSPIAAGFFLATDGLALTVLDSCTAGETFVAELHDGQRRTARVDGAVGRACALSVQPQATDLAFAALPVADRERPLADHEWLASLAHGRKGQVLVRVGGPREDQGQSTLLDLPSLPGAALLDGEGRAIGITWVRWDARRSQGLAIGPLLDATRALRATPPTTTTTTTTTTATNATKPASSGRSAAAKNENATAPVR